MALSYNVNALPDYVDQHRPELISEAVIGAKSADMFTLMSGVKGPTAINRISTDLSFSDGMECGWDGEDGTTSLSQSILTPKALKVNMSICDKYLLDKWANYLVKVQANKTDADLPFEKELVDSVIKNVKAEIENMIYKGDSSSNSTDFDGLYKQITSNIGNVYATVTESAVDVDPSNGVTAYQFIQKMALNMNPTILDKEDLVILVCMPMYNQFIQDLVNANLYHYNPGNGDNEYLLPGTNIRVIGVNGLNGAFGPQGDQWFVIGTTLSNLFYGCNMQDGDEIFDLWYSKDNREFRLAIEFVAGVAIAWYDEVTVGLYAVA